MGGWVGGGGGGGARGSEIEQNLPLAVNFAFSSMPSDMHAGERHARLERELKCKSEESDKAHCIANQPAVSIRLSRSLGFPTCLFLASPLSGRTSGAQWRQERSNFPPCFSLIEPPPASSRKAFNGVQKGQGHSKKHKQSKKYFCGRSTPGSPPAGLNISQRTSQNSQSQLECTPY